MKKKLLIEIQRCQDLLRLYEEIPEGFFGAVMIKQAISHAQRVYDNGTEKEQKEALKELEAIEG